MNLYLIQNKAIMMVLSSHEDFDDKKYSELNCGNRRQVVLENPMYKEMLPRNFFVDRQSK